MASGYAAGVISQAVLTSLKTYAPLTALVTGTDGTVRIVDEVPPAWLRTPDAFVPFVVVEIGGERPFNTMGPPSLPKFGSDVDLRVRIVSQYRGDAEVSTLMGHVKAKLEQQPMTVPGYLTASIGFESAVMHKDTVNGVTTRELVGIFSVTVHQS